MENRCKIEEKIRKKLGQKIRPVEVDRFDVDWFQSHFLAVVISRFHKLLSPPILAAQTVHGGPERLEVVLNDERMSNKTYN